MTKTGEIAAALRRKITDGTLAPGTRLPSYSGLAAEYGVSEIVVRLALQQLRTEQLVVSVRRVGTFVAERRPPTALGDPDLVRRARDAFAEHGLDAALAVYAAELAEVTASAAAAWDRVVTLEELLEAARGGAGADDR